MVSESQRLSDISALSPDSIRVVSTQEGKALWPSVRALPDGQIAVTWAEYRQGQWHVCCRMLRAGTLLPAEVVSEHSAGWYPASTVDATGRLWVAWVDLATHDIVIRPVGGHPAASPTPVSQGGHCCRPTMLACDDGLLLAWDQFAAGSYSIRARRIRVDGSLGRSWTVSRGREWQLLPQIGRSRASILCCWISQADVRDGRGVIDQRHTIRCARLDCGQWMPLGRDDLGTVADLSHGLLPTDTVRGYLGRQRHAVLRCDASGRAWLLSERKLDHAAHCSGGQLLGMPLASAGWGTPVELASGQVLYEAEQGSADAHGMLWTASRRPAERACWDIHLAPVHLDDGCGAQATLHKEIRADWQPITLPDDVRPSSPTVTITVQGEEYGILFGDLHAHSGLSGDAEGEPDEIFRYAQTKAGLDLVAVVDNDCYQVPLTRSQFALSRSWADWFDEPGRFTTLPGYEWTLWDRSLSSHPDHRTVLFSGQAELDRHIDPATPTTEAMARRVAQFGGLLVTQHWDWQLTGSAAECGLEVCSAWDTYIDRPEPFHRDLGAGRRLAFIGGSDSHRRNPGLCGALTGLWVREHSRAGVFEALRSRRCFATSGSRMVIDLRVNGAVMGSEIRSGAQVELRITAWGTRPLERLIIYRGQVGELPSKVVAVHALALSGRRAEIVWHDTPTHGTWFYYVILKQTGEDIRYPHNISLAQGCRAWSSPVWVRRLERGS